jgi:predicted nucleotidyltransferase
MNDGLSINIRNAIIAVFKQFTEIEDVILYGSRAIGTYKTSSDIDITLKGVDLSLLVLSKVFLMIDDLLLPYKVDISIYSHISNDALLSHINRVGKSLYAHTTVTV